MVLLCNKFFATRFWDNYEDDLIIWLFFILNNNNLTCFYSWFFGPQVTLSDCLSAFFSNDELKGDNMYSCEKCNKWVLCQSLIITSLFLSSSYIITDFEMESNTAVYFHCRRFCAFIWRDSVMNISHHILLNYQPQSHFLYM